MRRSTAASEKGGMKMKYDTDLTAVQVGQAVANLLRLGERTVCVQKKESGYTVATGNAANKLFDNHIVAHE